MSTRSPRFAIHARRQVRLGAVVLLAAVLIAIASAAGAQTSTPGTQTSTPGGASPVSDPGPSVADAQDMVVLSGAAFVPRGQAAGEIVVFHGRAVVSGVAFGDVVVLDGPVTVSGQVSGSVIALNGPVHLTRSAAVGGDVLGGQSVRIDDGATIAGAVRESVAFTPRGSLSVLGDLLGPLAVACSVLVVGLALLLLVPRGADRVAATARSAPLTSFAWGVATAIGLPLLGVALAVTLVALPVGLAVLLALAMLFLVGAAWSVWSVGRALLRDPRSRWLAFGAGWAIAVAISLVPYLNLAAWAVAGVFGTGAMLVATWRSRVGGGRHRAG